MEDNIILPTMELARLLSEEYATTADSEKPKNLCHHMVVHIRRNFFKKNRDLPVAFVKEVLRKVIPHLRALPNVIAVNRQNDDDAQGQFSGRVTVIGDLHGQFRDLGYLIGPNGPIGFPSTDNQIIVNGDMVDRGDMSVEILIILSLITLLVPGSVHMLKGNHEAASHLTTACGFDAEVRRKYPNDLELTLLFRQLFRALPVAAVVDGSVFVVHGGIGRLTKTIEDINKVPCRSDDDDQMYELLWNDPDERNGMNPHTRGEAFGPDITAAFLNLNNFSLLIRSHQHFHEGYMKHHNDLCWTVFSAANYCDCSGNKGAVLQFDQPMSCVPTIVQFEAVHYPVMPFVLPSKRSFDAVFNFVSAQLHTVEAL